MKITRDMVLAALGAGDMPDESNARAAVRAAIEESGIEHIERFAKVAARHAITDSLNSWNAMVDAWDALPQDIQRELLS